MKPTVIDELLSLMKADSDPGRQEQVIAQFLKDPLFSQFQSFSSQSVRILENKTFNYLYVSENIEQLTGYTVEEFRNGGLVFAYRHTHPLDLLMLPWLTIQSHAAVKRLTPEERLLCRLSYDVRFKTKGGNYVRLLQHVHNLAMGEDGKPSVLMFISSDITAYKTSKLMNYSFSVSRNGVFESVLQGVRQPEPPGISERELEILRLTADGLTEKVIADKLFISSETVKVHRRNMLAKTNMKNAVELVRYAMANNWM